MGIQIHQKSELRLFGVTIKLNDDEDDAKQKPKFPRLVAPNPQPLPLTYRDFVLVKGGDRESIQLVLRKRLTSTDMNPNHGRLSLPRKMIEKSFLFSLSTSPFEMRSMKMAKWNYNESVAEKKNNWWLALTNDWIKFSQENHLCAGDAIQIWSWRPVYFMYEIIGQNYCEFKS